MENEDEGEIDQDENEGGIRWSPDSPDDPQGAGELTVVVPAAAGVRETVIKRRASSAGKAAKSASKMANRILSSSVAQAAMPPQARTVLRAARALSKFAPRKWRRWF